MEAIVERARSFFRADEPAPSASRDLWRSVAAEAGASKRAVCFCFARDLSPRSPLGAFGELQTGKKTTRRRLEDINIPVWMFGTIWQPPRGLCRDLRFVHRLRARFERESDEPAFVTRRVARLRGSEPRARMAPRTRRTSRSCSGPRARARGDDAGDAHVVEFCGPSRRAAEVGSRARRVRTAPRDDAPPSPPRARLVARSLTPRPPAPTRRVPVASSAPAALDALAPFVGARSPPPREPAPSNPRSSAFLSSSRPSYASHSVRNI